MEKIYQKIDKIKEILRILQSIKINCLDKFETDPVYRGALLYYLYLLTDSSIALGEMIIKFRRLRYPSTYYETFEILGEAGILNREFADHFAGIAGFRNFLAHDYEKVRKDAICDTVENRIPEIIDYLARIEEDLIRR